MKKVGKESGCEQTEHLNRMAVYIIRWEGKRNFMYRQNGTSQ